MAPRVYGADGWIMRLRAGGGSVIVSYATWPMGADEEDWVHASISFKETMPTYEDLVTLHKAVWKGKGWAYQVFAPDQDHVNIHPFALHLWGRLDGRPVLPDFVAIAGIKSI